MTDSNNIVTDEEEFERIYSEVAHHFMYCESDSWEANTDIEDLARIEVTQYYNLKHSCQQAIIG